MSSRMRQTHSKTRKRRSHHGLTAARLSACENCGAEHLRHRACDSCGMYRGRQVIDMDNQKETEKGQNTTEQAASEATKQAETTEANTS